MKLQLTWIWQKPLSAKDTEDNSAVFTVSLDPDNILPSNTKHNFTEVLQRYDSVFDPAYKGYNGAFSDCKAVVNMGPVQPPQRKGWIPQYTVILELYFPSLLCIALIVMKMDV